MSSDPTIDEQAEFYDLWNKKNRSGQFDEVSDEIRLRAEEVLAYLSSLNLRGARILEVGCGTGWLTQRLNEYGSVTAIDLSPAAIKIARDRDSRASYIAGDFFSHDFGEMTFNVIVCVETLFYVQNQESFVRRLASLATQDALFTVTTVNKFVYARRRDIGPPEPGQIRRWLSRRETRALIGRYFEIISMYTIQPRGDSGILRVVNSSKLNRILEIIVSAAFLKRAKERCGLGAGVILLARKRGIEH